MAANGPLRLNHDMIYEHNDQTVSGEALAQILKLHVDIAKLGFKNPPLKRWILLKSHDSKKFIVRSVQKKEEEIIYCEISLQKMNLTVAERVLSNQGFNIEDYLLPPTHPEAAQSNFSSQQLSSLIHQSIPVLPREIATDAAANLGNEIFEELSSLMPFLKIFRAQNIQQAETSDPPQASDSLSLSEDPLRYI